MLEFSRSLYLCNHLSESIHSWTKGTLPKHTPPNPTPTLSYSYPNPTPHYTTYPTLPLLTLPYPTATPPDLPNPYLYPNPYRPTLPYPILIYTTLPYLTLPYFTLPRPTLPFSTPLRIQTHAHKKASHSRAKLSCDSSYSEKIQKADEISRF